MVSLSTKVSWIKRIGLLAACSLAFAVSGCSLLPKEEAALKPPLVKPVKENFELYEVKRGSIIKKMTFMATFASSKTQNLYFKESGQRLLSINVKLGDTVKPGDIVAQLDTGDLETRVRMQQLNVEKAQISLVQAKTDRPDDAAAIRLKTIDMESAQIQLELLQTQLEKAKLKSDQGGIVTYMADINQGDVVAAYSNLISIADPKQVQLVYQATNNNDISAVQVGMEAEVKLKNSTVKGKVLQTPSSAPLSTNKAQAEKNAKTLIIGLDKAQEGTEIGSYGDITIITEHRDDVLIIPPAGLRSYIGREYVQILDGESRKEIDVEKGLVTSTEVEIRKGLKEGQKVIINN
jgi:multidrug efflux pump subunit AcrA (membrane-fusion protein)